MAASAGFIWENAHFAVLLLRALVRGDRGQTLSEDSLLLTLVGVGAVVPTVSLMRTALVGAFSDVAGCLLGTTC